ncbi:hypothetical protein C7441_107112 [Pseudaminobacter salicylatoxidans]|uniref:Uncharacterized protein n=1 Tax=Pseudaminobacter salicylatoxidans TaxID=93369 RepID=A0A316C2I3_PSESE|nr:hypothetical protein [Pseudaminobacter salicylatoxidans]PWJ83952.1 hypothetical protein C7441_107112 [Pseudaminobacter salicylatoxidans]
MNKFAFAFAAVAFSFSVATAHAGGGFGSRSAGNVGHSSGGLINISPSLGLNNIGVNLLNGSPILSGINVSGILSGNKTGVVSGVLNGLGVGILGTGAGGSSYKAKGRR